MGVNVKRLADTVGIAHYLFATFLTLIGQALPNAFPETKDRFKGLSFIYNYVDVPVYKLLSSWILPNQKDVVSALLLGQVVIIISSLAYALLFFLVVKIVEVLFIDTRW